MRAKTRTGPKLRPRYCTVCGVKCEGARVAAGHCRGGGGKGKGKTGTVPKKNLSQ